MFNMGNAPSVADIAAVTGNNRGNGWGGDGDGLWAIIILLALFGGFGNRGSLFGGASSGAGSCCAPATCADLQRGFDNQGVTNKLNGLENGLCSLGYDQLAQMNGINQNISQTAFGLERAISNMGVANMQDTNALSRQLSDCCCDLRGAIKEVQFQNERSACDIQNSINWQAQQIIQNDNANYRALHDELVSYKMQQKDETIADLRSQVSAFNQAVSQRNLSDYLVDRLQPCPRPAYFVPNPNCCYGPGANAYGFFNNGCGNGCNSGCC